jgi:sugar O-acyltransferase (sialic acid O-acetyltransferase NeuD family)
VNDILLIGGGGHCRSAIDVIESDGRYVIRGIVQPDDDGCESVLGYPVLGGDSDLPGLLAQTPFALVTVGQIKTAAVRERLYDLLRQHGAELPVIVSSRACVSRYASVADGTLVMHGALVNACARVGVNCIVNSFALIEHDAVVGDHCHVSTGCRINGGVTVEASCFIGSGAVLREGVHIGAGSVIGAGCVVNDDVAPNSLLKVLS